jgi:LysM repeat protein
MKYHYVLWASLCILQSAYALAQNPTKDTLTNKNTASLPLQHKIAKGETLYKIAKKYKKDVKTLMAYNQLPTQNIQEGQVLRIPTTTPTAPISTSTSVKYHTVQKGETLYKIADLYKISLDSLLLWNQLTSQSILSVNQQLKVSANAPLTISEKNFEKIDRKKVSYEIGKGMKIPTTSNEKVALHRTAPIGSTVTVINSANRLATKVKIIGKIPTIARNNDVIIKLSEAACKELAVVNEYFAVEVYFEKPNTQ